MSDCSRYKILLPLSARGDLGEREIPAIQAHLAVCQACRDEEAKFLSVISVSRAAMAADHELPPFVRSKIAREAAVRSARRSWRLPLPILDLQARPGLLATVTAMLVALLVLPVALRTGGGNQPAGEAAVRIEVVTNGRTVHLGWSDGTRSSYTVYKSSDPRAVTRGEAHRVRGNAWTDNDPESSPVVFYTIE
jgi:hypothetical protein